MTDIIKDIALYTIALAVTTYGIGELCDIQDALDLAARGQ